MVRARMLARTARANSAVTSHQKWGGGVPCVLAAYTMRSMISLVIHNSRTGVSDAARRAMSPNTTTHGPESHTILRTAGTLRSAEMRSRHPIETFSWSAIRLILPPSGLRLLVGEGRHAAPFWRSPASPVQPDRSGKDAEKGSGVCQQVGPTAVSPTLRTTPALPEVSHTSHRIRTTSCPRHSANTL